MRIPLSLGFFVVQAVLLPLEYLPSTGASLDMVGAPFWSTILLNLGFLGIGFEATLRRRIGLLWLLAPLLWFGGYTALAVKDRIVLKAERADVATHNSAVTIPFDPLRHALVAKEILFNDGIGGTRDSTAGLVQHYGLPVFYRAKKYIRGASHMATRVVEVAVCRETRLNSSPARTDFFASWIADYRGPHSSPHDQRFCVIDMPEDPTLPPVMVEKTNERTSRLGLPLHRISTTVIMPDEARYGLKGGLAEVLSWWPVPFVGCYSTGSSPHGDTRECVAGFYRDIVQLVTVDKSQGGDNVALAAALGLQRVSLADRKATTSMELARSLIDAAQQRIVVLELGELDRVIADPTAATSFVPFETLVGRLDIIQPRLGPIVAAIEQGIQLGGKAKSNAGQMFRLLETIPRDAIAPHLDRIEAIRVKDSSFVFKPAK